MNKDKIIKDLKERNDKLKHQYELQEIRLHSLEYKNNKQKELLDKIKEILKDPDRDGFDEDGYDDSYYDMIYTQRIKELLEEIE